MFIKFKPNFWFTNIFPLTLYISVLDLTVTGQILTENYLILKPNLFLISKELYTVDSFILCGHQLSWIISFHRFAEFCI